MNSWWGIVLFTKNMEVVSHWSIMGINGTSHRIYWPLEEGDHPKEWTCWRGLLSLRPCLYLCNLYNRWWVMQPLVRLDLIGWNRWENTTPSSSPLWRHCTRWARKPVWYVNLVLAQFPCTSTGIPLGLESMETWKTFSSQGILNRLEKSGKITQNTGKLREFQTYYLLFF